MMINTNENNLSKLKPKKNIKKEYYDMKPTLIRAHNLRFIEPYDFKYQLYTKGRWVGKRLIDVLIFEFRQYDKEYFLKAIKEGKLKINNKLVDPDHTLKRDDFITHLVIRKENPIIDQNLEIVFESEDFLVVDKPSSWPVHVCGGYQFNTLHRILMDEFGFSDLKVLHRLDKHTSGIVIMAKNKKSAENFRKKLHTDKVQKTYLCRVKGDFTPEKINVIRSIIYVDRAKGVYTDVDDVNAVNYLEVAKNENNLKAKSKGSNVYYATDSEKKGKKYDKSGVRIKSGNNQEEEDSEDDDRNEPKYAETDFEKLFYDEKSNTSVVIAKPKTGRTHQIRIHLRFLGFPIANDPCYGGIIYNDLKDFDNPDLLKFQQFVPEEESQGGEKVLNNNISGENNDILNQNEKDELKIISTTNDILKLKDKEKEELQLNIYSNILKHDTEKEELNNNCNIPCENLPDTNNNLVHNESFIGNKEYKNNNLVQNESIIVKNESNPPPKIEEPKSNTLTVSQIYCYKIWLHAWNYKFDDYTFVTKRPAWAEENYQINFKF